MLDKIKHKKEDKHEKYQAINSISDMTKKSSKWYENDFK